MTSDQGFQFAAADAKFYDYLRNVILPIRPSQYDISNICNLSCEGCFFFVGTDYLGHPEVADLGAVEAFFEGEARRGVNYAEVAGAEPSLAEEKLVIMARHIRRGVIYTNGTRVIPTEIPYKLQISLWGLPEQSARLRGANVVAKQVRNYRDDDRAVFVFTINRENVWSIPELARFCAGEGIRLTFNHFSPTESYRARLSHPNGNRDRYFRFSDRESNLLLQPSDLVRSRALIADAIDRYPETIVYSRTFNDWVHRPGGLYQVDPSTGIATDCGGMLTKGYRHFHADLTDAGDVKCPTPNIACEDCRCYAQAWGTALRRHTGPALRHNGGDTWIELWKFWCRLFLFDRVLDAQLREAKFSTFAPAVTAKAS